DPGQATKLSYATSVGGVSKSPGRDGPGPTGCPLLSTGTVLNSRISSGPSHSNSTLPFLRSATAPPVDASPRRLGTDLRAVASLPHTSASFARSPPNLNARA